MGYEKNQILADAKLLLKIDSSDEDAILSFLAEDCMAAVMSYCHLEFLPYQLLGIVAQMTAGRYRQEYQRGDGGDNAVSSITEGDRKIEFSVPEKKNITEDYAERLKPFINRKGWMPSEQKGRDQR